MKVNTDTTPGFNLENVDPEDMGDVLVKIERSFNISLNDTSLNEVKTFGKLCDVVTEKVKKTNNDSCTTQQAFYKLRSAITASAGHDKDLVKPQTKLVELFPRDSRIEAVAAIEEEMGFQINLLQPKQWVIALFGAVLALSVIALFYIQFIGIMGIVIAVAGLRLAGKFGKEMQVKTIGDLAEKIAREHYLKCRRDASTVNKGEIAQKLKELFRADLYINQSTLSRDSKF